MSKQPVKSEPAKRPGWVGPLAVIGGIIAIILGIVVWFFPVGTVLTVTYILLFALIILGVVSIIRGIVNKTVSSGQRTLEVILGFIVLAIACVGLFYPGWTTVTLYWIIAFGLMIYGFQIMFIGFAASGASGGQRALLVILGILDIIISLGIFWAPYVGVVFEVFFFSLALLIVGISLIAIGIRK
jgi:uncharacterized membrane protein HdeD (DUF308 family)